MWVKEHDGRMTWVMDEEIMKELGRSIETKKSNEGEESKEGM